MPDEIYIGRYYKLYALPKYGGLEEYEYSISDPNGCVEIIAKNTIEVLKEGSITISVSGSVGENQKTIECKQYPSIERKIVEYTFENSKDFKSYVESINEPTVIRFLNDADIITDETINVPYGVILDFNWKNIKIGSVKVEQKATFVFDEDHCGIYNLKLYSSYPDWSNHTAGDKYTQAHTMFMIRGSFFVFENFVCVNKQNGGIGIASWGSHHPSSRYSKSYTWNEGDMNAGYINEFGNVEQEDDAWHSEEFITLPDNVYFSVGHFANFLQWSSKTYAVAFYTSEGEFIECRYGLQFYRGYEKPENASKCKLMVWNASEPPLIKVGESGGMDWNYYLYVTGSFNTHEIYIKNCKSLLNESGMIDFVGDFNELNLIECKCLSGKTNSWSIDFEDGWMGMKDVVIKSCLLQHPVFHSVQGLSVINSFIYTTNLQSWVNGVVFSNVILSIYGYLLSGFYNPSQITQKMYFEDVIINYSGTTTEDISSDDYITCVNCKRKPGVHIIGTAMFTAPSIKSDNSIPEPSLPEDEDEPKPKIYLYDGYVMTNENVDAEPSYNETYPNSAASSAIFLDTNEYFTAEATGATSQAYRAYDTEGNFLMTGYNWGHQRANENGGYVKLLCNQGIETLDSFVVHKSEKDVEYEIVDMRE